MLRKIYFSVVMILLILLGVFFGGGTKPSEISRSDLKLVNAYLAEVDADSMPLSSAESLNHWLYENNQTRQIKTGWQLVVDYVQNQQDGQAEPLGYTFVFEGSSFSMEDNEGWEPIGGKYAQI